MNVAKAWRWVVALLLGAVAVFGVGCTSSQSSKAGPASEVKQAKVEAAKPKSGTWEAKGLFKDPLFDSAVPSRGTSVTARALLEEAAGVAVSRAVVDESEHEVLKVHVPAVVTDETDTFKPFFLLLAPDIAMSVGRAESGWLPEQYITVIREASYFTDGRKHQATVQRVGGLEAVVQERGTQDLGGGETNEVRSCITYQVGGFAYQWFSGELTASELKAIVAPAIRASLEDSAGVTP